MGSSTIKDDTTRRVLQQNLRTILATLSLSENMLATRAKVSQKHVNNITNARYGCNIDTVAYIAKELGVPAWFLLVPGAGEAYEDGRRIANITEAMIRATPAERLSTTAIVKKLSVEK